MKEYQESQQESEEPVVQLSYFEIVCFPGDTMA